MSARNGAFAQDKILHVVVCAGLALAMYAFLTTCAWGRRCCARCCTDYSSARLKLAASLSASMVIGLGKELGDFVGAWPWCDRSGCSCSAGDIVADAVGVGIAGLVVVAQWRWSKLRATHRCGRVRGRLWCRKRETAPSHRTPKAADVASVASVVAEGGLGLSLDGVEAGFSSQQQEAPL